MELHGIKVENEPKSPVRTALIVTSVIFLLVISVSLCWDYVSATVLPNTTAGIYKKVFWENILVEMHGVMLELAVIGVLIVWLDSRRNRNSEITRLHEDLNDYALLDFPEINVKKLGHLKRLNSMGVKSFNVQNLVLSNLVVKNFAAVDSNLIGLKVRSSTLANSNFSNVKMRSSSFENAVIRNTKFEKCDLLKSNFLDATCKGISFHESSVERADFTNCDLQSSYFVDSDVRGIKLKGANLNRCSFRGARNVEVKELAKAASLDYIVLEEELLEQLLKLRPDITIQTKNGRARRN